MKRIIATAVCIPILAIGFSACSSASKKKKITPSDRAALLIQVANGALAERDFAQALTSLFQAEALNEKLPQLHHSKALAYIGKRDLRAALTSVNRALELAPKQGYSAALNTKGKILLDMRRFKEAEAPLLKAATDPIYRESYKPRTNLGILYYRKREYTKAHRQFDRAIHEAPPMACIAFFYRGNISLRKRSYKDAISDYRRASREFCASFLEAHYALGIAYAKKGDFDRARRKFVEIGKVFPNTKIAQKAVDRLRDLP